MRLHGITYVLVTTLFVTVALAGCDSLLETSSEAEQASVDVQLRNAAPQQSSKFAGKQRGVLDEHELVVQGTNGTLTITDLRFVLSKFELEGEGSDDDVEREFEWEHSGELKVEDGEVKLTSTFVDVPLGLNEEQVLGAFENLDPVDGSYDKLEFKIEETDFDDDQGLLLEEIQSVFPEWPEEASLVAVGTFEPTDGEPRDFTAFFDAEIKIELELDPPLEVSGGDTPDITIDFDPTRLFERPDGTVIDLSQHDDSPGDELIEFELEIEDGFDDIEFEYDS